MKAPAFDYAKPRSLDEVFQLLAQHGDAARLLAGGQTLLATLNMRLSEPSLLIDINDRRWRGSRPARRPCRAQRIALRLLHLGHADGRR